MKVEQFLSTEKDNWQSLNGESLKDANLVFVFGEKNRLKTEDYYDHLKVKYPKADIVSASTSGEIVEDFVVDDSITGVAIQFEKTEVKAQYYSIKDKYESYDIGVEIAKNLLNDDLKHVLIIADGHIINGSYLVKGITEKLPKSITTTGGLAGDADRFEETVVSLNKQATSSGVVAIGFYGDAIKIGYGTEGGWDTFGPERIVTSSKDNVLMQLDDQSALDLYKKYLGPQADALPGSSLLFPLAIKNEVGKELVVRTILSIDDEQKTMTFAGNLPVGSKAQLMKANFDRLIDGAVKAAEESLTRLNQKQPDLAILISCVGRKLILNQRIDEEVESIKELYKGDTILTGFYSYGEIAPFGQYASCELHNQTMTITTFTELVD